MVKTSVPPPPPEEGHSPAEIVARFEAALANIGWPGDLLQFAALTIGGFIFVWEYRSYYRGTRLRTEGATAIGRVDAVAPGFGDEIGSAEITFRDERGRPHRFIDRFGPWNDSDLGILVRVHYPPDDPSGAQVRRPQWRMILRMVLVGAASMACAGYGLSAFL